VLAAGAGAYAVAKFRHRPGDWGREPAQVFGSHQLELAWTVVPLLIVVVLFLTTARVIHAIEEACVPANALQVTVIGHQWWWEFRYPQYGVVTANELWVPESSPEHPQPTSLTLLSARTELTEAAKLPALRPGYSTTSPFDLQPELRGRVDGSLERTR